MSDWMEELERLAELRDKGLISNEEFGAERAKIVPPATSRSTEVKPESNEASRPIGKTSTPSPSQDKMISKPQNQKEALSDPRIKAKQKLSTKVDPKTGVLLSTNRQKPTNTAWIIFLLVVVAFIVGIVLIQRGDSSDSNNSTQGSFVSPTPKPPWTHSTPRASPTPTPRDSSSSATPNRSSIEKLVRCSDTGHSYILQWNSTSQDFVDAFIAWQQDYSFNADSTFLLNTINIELRYNSIISDITNLKNSSDCNQLRDVLEDMITWRKLKVSGMIDIRSGIRNQNLTLANQGVQTIQSASLQEINIICNDWLPILESYSYAFDASDRVIMQLIKGFC